jgi:hypothetical protein
VTTNGPLLTSGEAQEALDCQRPQLYRWRDKGYLKGKKESTAGTGRYLWEAESVEELRKRLPPKSNGSQRRVRRPGPTKAELRHQAWVEKEVRRHARNAGVIAVWQTGKHTQYELDRILELPPGTVWRILHEAGISTQHSS